MPVQGYSVEYRVLPNGTAYEGTVVLANSSGYQVYETGSLGERISVKVTNITLQGDCDPCRFNQTGEGAISFPKGNYILSYQAPVKENHITATYTDPYNVSVILPKGLDVRNPFLGVVSPGGSIGAVNNSSVTINWTGARSMELRFYDEQRESLLYMFGNFWIIIAIVLLTPYLLTMRRRGK